MFKEISAITKNYAIVTIDPNIVNEDLLNYHVVFEDDDKKILGEVQEISNDSVKISFMGEFTEGRFVSGIIRKPSLNAKIRIINNDELDLIIGKNSNKNMLLGLSPLYSDAKIYIDINELLSNHSAYFGNTGSGKTYGISRIIQNLFENGSTIPFNANIFIFNSSNEYDNAFKNINSVNPNFNYKMYTTNGNSKSTPLLNLPLWHLSVDDYANLLDVTEYSQISIIDKMLSFVSVFARKDAESKKYQNHLIASAILSVLYTSQKSATIRDQIFNILYSCNTSELNLDFEIPGVGYTRQLRKCFDIDSQGEFVERRLVTGYIESFIDTTTKWSSDYVPVFFTLDDLEVALNFTLISEGLLLNEKHYSEAIALKVKLHSINTGATANLFRYDKFITLQEWISDLVIIEGNKRCQIVNFVLEDIDDRMAKALVKVYSRLFFKFAKGLPTRGTFPMHLMVEEAHRYVQRDNDTYILGYNIFERIAKEGRKYGVIMDLITQRPTELSETVISQCSNFMIFKINHPTDLEYISKMVPNISADIIEKQKSLQSGTCVAFGRMMMTPMIVKMELPNPEPHSANSDIYDKWMVSLKKE